MILVETWVCEPCGRGWPVEVREDPGSLEIRGSTTCPRCLRVGKRREVGTYARIPL